MLWWIDYMFGSTQQFLRGSLDEYQFQSAMRSMVVTTIVLFEAEYFLGVSKCCFILEKVMTYLAIECASLHGR